MLRISCAVALALGMTWLAACQRSPDAAAAEAFEQGSRRYRALVLDGISPADRAFDEVLAKLDEVPRGSRQRAQADRLRNAILAARAPRPPVPLVLPGTGTDGGSDLLHQECIRLAREVGLAEGERRRELAQRLTICQRSLEAMRLAEQNVATPANPVTGPQ